MTDGHKYGTNSGIKILAGLFEAKSLLVGVETVKVTKEKTFKLLTL